MSKDPPATLDEPDTDCEVIAKLRERVADLQAQWGYTESIQQLAIERLTAALQDTKRTLWLIVKSNGGYVLEKPDVEDYPGDDRAVIEQATQDQCVVFAARTLT